MMKKICLVLLMLLNIKMCCAQVAQWRLRSHFDTMYVPVGTNVVVTDSMGQASLWSFEGERIFQTEDVIHTFRDGLSVLTGKDGLEITGFVKATGESVRLQRQRFIVADSPQFSNGHLLVRDKADGCFRYIDSMGNVFPRQFIRAYPFTGGYASCMYYENPERKKSLVPCLLSEKMVRVPVTVNNKLITADDLDFISSVNDEGVALVVAKKKAYLFVVETGIMKLLCASLEAENPKMQAELAQDIERCLRMEGDDSWSMVLRCGKKYGTIEVLFDRLMRPTAIVYADGTKKTFKAEEVREVPERSDFRGFRDEKGYGLAYSGRAALVPQFEDIVSCFGDYAIVRQNGKYGLLRLFPDEGFRLSIHEDGESVPFSHKFFKTSLTLEFPSFIPTDLVAVEVPANSGYTIDYKTERRWSVKGINYLQYECRLELPKELLDEDSAEIDYPVRVVYDGLVFPMIFANTSVWFRKSWVPIIDESRKVVRNGGISFPFSCVNDLNDGQVYKLYVSVFFDSTELEAGFLNKFSDTRYECSIPQLKEGENNIVIQLLEDGTPPSRFPYRFIYHKPVEKSVEAPEGKEEEVEILKVEPMPRGKSKKHKVKRPKAADNSYQLPLELK